MEEWRNDINDEIDSINRSLSYAPVREKASTIRDWIRSVLGKIVHYYIQSRASPIAAYWRRNTVVSLHSRRCRLGINELRCVMRRYTAIAIYIDTCACACLDKTAAANYS